ncbi:HPP family protein [Daldinia decipiens]|uniref:HPP family protein n=1 Tax=Daldinia decipiens TaxID=326647 RepID=UPI0020C53F33|nr:HPP family protein [Daldinia decipiens]KAI1662752.1 HPP family protein [Daldinia decipiens]
MPLQPTKWHFEIDQYLNPWIPAAPWKHLPYPVAHFLGHRSEHQRPLGNIAMTFWAFIGVFCSLTIIEAVGHAIPSFEEHGAPMIIGSFGAAAVLEFYAIESPLSQPRNAVLGQLFSSLIGVAIRKLFALSPMLNKVIWVAGSLSCSCAVAFMALTGTVHPPAGATALLAVIDEGVAHLGWFLPPVVLLSCALMQCVALLLNNIQRRFPVYWWTPAEVGRREKQQQQPQQHQISDEKSSNIDSGSDNGARLKVSTIRHMEEGKIVIEPSRVVITKGHVAIPDDMYLSPEEKMFLAGLSERL